MEIKYEVEFDAKKEIEKIQEELECIKRTIRYPTKECFTLEQVAEMSGRSLQTIREQKKSGKLIVRFPVAKKCFHPDDVQDWLRGQKRNKHGILC